MDRLLKNDICGRISGLSVPEKYGGLGMDYIA